jgi:hypothetical protein
MNDPRNRFRELVAGAGAAEAPAFHTISAADWKRSIERARKEPNEIALAIRALVAGRREIARQADELADAVGGPSLTGIPLKVAIRDFGKGRGNEVDVLKAAGDHKTAVEQAIALGRAEPLGQSIGRNER